MYVEIKHLRVKSIARQTEKIVLENILHVMQIEVDTQTKVMVFPWSFVLSERSAWAWDKTVVMIKLIKEVGRN